MSDATDELRRMADFLDSNNATSRPPKWLTDMITWPLDTLDARTLAEYVARRAYSDEIFRSALPELLRESGLCVTVHLYQTHVENRRLPLRLSDV